MLVFCLKHTDFMCWIMLFCWFIFVQLNIIVWLRCYNFGSQQWEGKKDRENKSAALSLCNECQNHIIYVRTHRFEILDQIHSATDNTIFYWRIKLNAIKSFLSFLSSLLMLTNRSYLSFMCSTLYNVFDGHSRLRHFNRKIWKKLRTQFTSIFSVLASKKSLAVYLCV